MLDSLSLKSLVAAHKETLADAAQEKFGCSHWVKNRYDRLYFGGIGNLCSLAGVKYDWDRTGVGDVTEMLTGEVLREAGSRARNAEFSEDLRKAYLDLATGEVVSDCGLVDRLVIRAVEYMARELGLISDDAEPETAESVEEAEIAVEEEAVEEAVEEKPMTANVAAVLESKIVESSMRTWIEGEKHTVDENGVVTFTGFGRQCTITLNRDEWTLIEEGKVTFVRKYGAFKNRFAHAVTRAIEFARRLVVAEDRATTLADIADYDHLGWSEDHKDYLDGHFAYANHPDCKESEWLDAVRATIVPLARVLPNGEELIAKAEEIARRRFCADVITEEQIDNAEDLAWYRAMQEGLKKMSEAIEEQQAEAENDDELLTDAAEVFCVDFSARCSDQDWDYESGLVDVDLISQAEVALAKEGGESISLEKTADGWRLIASLALVGRILAPRLVAGECFDDLINDRRIQPWDPTAYHEAIDQLYSGDGAATKIMRERVQRAVKWAESLELDGERWTEESLLEAWVHDDESWPQCLRCYQAKLIAINDPMLAYYVGDRERERDRARACVEDDLYAQCQDLCALYGYRTKEERNEFYEAQLENLRAIERNVQYADYT